MHIAIDIRSTCGEKTGKGIYTENLVRNLLKLDQENDYILYTQVPNPAFEGFHHATQRVIKGRGILWHRNVVKDMKKSYPDIFFAPSSYIIPTMLPPSIKSIVTVHDLVALLFPQGHNKKAVFIENMAIKKALKKSSAVLAVSQHTKKDILERFTTSDDKIKVINCSSNEKFTPIPKDKLKEFIVKTNLPEKFFLAVGTIIPRKNYVNLIRAFSSVERHYPEYHLIIVGQDGWQAENLYSEIAENSLGKKVHILGYLSQSSLISLYSLASALVFPSLYEGFGIPPLEAMRSGCPVLASDSSSIPEVVGEAAILFDPQKYKEIVAAMLQIIENPKLAAELREAGFKNVERFSWGKSAAELLEVIKSV